MVLAHEARTFGDRGLCQRGICQAAVSWSMGTIRSLLPLPGPSLAQYLDFGHGCVEDRHVPIFAREVRDIIDTTLHRCSPSGIYLPPALTL